MFFLGTETPSTLPLNTPLLYLLSDMNIVKKEVFDQFSGSIFFFTRLFSHRRNDLCRLRQKIVQILRFE